MGFWAHNCEEECDAGCEGGHCLQHDGWCDCQAGKFGVSEIVDGKRTPACSKACPHCLSPPLKSDVVCNAITGRCSDCPSTPAAKYGPMCELDCPEHCEEHCHRDTGICKCKSGYWGKDCEACPEKCTNMCDDEGKCVDGCELGFWGDTCTEKCSEHCHGNLCKKEDGHCVRGCVTGWWSLDCKEDCPENTKENMGCSIETGHSNACKTGFWGDKCEEDCPPNCEDGCNKEDGTCTSCVNSEWYGKKCETRCSKDCMDGECNMVGECSSCAQDENMNFLRWGIHCENECAENCVSGCDIKNGKCNKCAYGTWIGKSGFCDSVCHVSCGSCDGPSENDCTECDGAATLKKNGKASTCECVQPFAKRWQGADQIVPRGPAGHTLRKGGKCTCTWSESDGIAQKYLYGAGSGEMKYCSPGSPRGTVAASGTVYPTGILWPPAEGWQQGRCDADALEVVPDTPFCVHLVAAVEMYKSDRIGSSVLPPASEWDASRVCSTWNDVSDAECQKGDAGDNTRTPENDVKCGLLVDSFCMPKVDWEHTTAGHKVRGGGAPPQIFV